MAVLRFKFINSYRDRHGKMRHYFRKGAIKEPLFGLPGSKVFMDEYNRLLALHAPKPVKRGKAEQGTLSWVIGQFKQSKAWIKVKPSTRGVYERRLQYLNDSFGAADFPSFDEKGIRSIRNKLIDTPSIADNTVQMIGRLWRFAKEHLEMELGADPTGEVSRVHTEHESHTAWPPELCNAVEKHEDPHMVRAYFLLRYTGLRRSDVACMKSSQFDGTAVELYQVKTGTYVWMPAHPALREHLTKTGTRGATLLAYRGNPYTPVGLSNLIRKTVERLGYPGYSAHGLRHLAGAALAECGASVHEIMSILGHTTEKQAMEYTRQANRKKMAANAMAKWGA